MKWLYKTKDTHTLNTRTFSSTSFRQLIQRKQLDRVHNSRSNDRFYGWAYFHVRSLNSTPILANNWEYFTQNSILFIYRKKLHRLKWMGSNICWVRNETAFVELRTNVMRMAGRLGIAVPNSFLPYWQRWCVHVCLIMQVNGERNISDKLVDALTILKSWVYVYIYYAANFIYYICLFGLLLLLFFQLLLMPFLAIFISYSFMSPSSQVFSFSFSLCRSLLRRLSSLSGTSTSPS